MFKLWQRGHELVSVTTQPLLASWERSTDPAQIRLQRYLDDIERAFRPQLKTANAYYLSIEVGLPDSVDILHHYDLENYLTPVAHRLRELPIVLACATKRTGGQSRISVGTAQPLTETTLRDEWQHVSVRCSGSPQAKQWKQDLRATLLRREVATAQPGPLEMQVAWRCSSLKNWINLWKPTGDALGPILGEPLASQPFNPSDDRIVALDLHLGRDDSLGYEVDVGIWWQAAPA
jgi:hypothetical protein